MSDQPGSLREAIAAALYGTDEWTPGEVANIERAVAQWFRDHETERIEAGLTARGSDHEYEGTAHSVTGAAIYEGDGLNAAELAECADVCDCGWRGDDWVRHVRSVGVARILRASDAVVFGGEPE